MRILPLLTALLVLGMTSCRSGKLQKKGVDLGGTAAAPGDFAVVEPQFTQLRLKSETAVQSSALTQKFPVTFHILKDSVIWASVTLGLELGRAKITKDSLFFLDRFNRKAYIGTWEEVSRIAGAEMSYPVLQSLLTGGMPFPREESDVLEAGEAVTLLRQVRRGVTFENKIDNGVHKVFEVVGSRADSGARLELNFSRFITEGQQLIPSVISMVVTGQRKSTLEITHSRIEVDGPALSFSFQIPASYTLVPLSGI